SPYELSASVNGEVRRCEALARHIDGNYLRVLGIPLLAGRNLGPLDDIRKPVPVLINQVTSHLLFGIENPVGRLMTTWYRDRKVLEVVGVVGDTRQLGLTAEPGPQLYVPQAYAAARFVIARMGLQSSDPASAIRAAARAIDPQVPNPEIQSMDMVFSR